MTDLQQPVPAPVPVFRISVSNASILSVVYLLVGITVEAARRFTEAQWAHRLSLSMEIFPARTLQVLGLFEPLHRAFLEDRVTEWQVRVVYALTSVVIIFASGILVGALMWVVSKLGRRGVARE